MDIKTTDGKIVKRDYMFIFDEMEFYSKLDNAKKQFNQIVSDTAYDARFKLYGFIVSNKDIAKKYLFKKVWVFPSVANDYYDGIGKIVQKEGKGKMYLINLWLQNIYFSKYKQTYITRKFTKRFYFNCLSRKNFLNKRNKVVKRKKNIKMLNKKNAKT